VWELRHEGGQGEKSAGVSRVLVQPMDQNGTEVCKKFPCSLHDISAVIS
jgi:hypothetical protein